jgi:radical SAM protein with 4Fe4S-binding SPASM domain
MRDSAVQERSFSQKPSGSPSLRYLLIHLTSECNLRCRHCYLGEPEKQSLALNTVEKLIDDMQESQGLTVLLSGGEALRYNDFWRLNEKIPEYDMTFYLLTNGTLMTEEYAKKLNINNVQVSLDGLEKGHDFMRGSGHFKESLFGVQNLIKAGKRVSIATMVHKNNLDEFEEMEKLLMDYGVEKWIITSPCNTGRWENNSEYGVDVKTAAPIIRRYSRNVEGPHKSTTIYACGTHMIAVMPDGTYSSCPVLRDSLGKANETSLADAWKSKKRIKIDELSDCKSCETIESCKGGCRYNAMENGNIYGKDPLACEILYKGVK